MIKITAKIWLALIVALAFGLRIWHSTISSLWHDEAFSAILIKMPFDQMMNSIRLDVHPPFYYWVLDAWAGIAGHSVASLRGLSVLLGTATVIAVYVLIKELLKREDYALASAFLVAVNPFHIIYSLEARMYGLGAFLVVLSTWVLVKALRNNAWRWWLGYTLLVTASALTHYYLFFSLVPQFIIALIWFWQHRKENTVGKYRWLKAFILSAVLYIPWLPILLEQFQRVSGGFWIPPMTIWSLPTIIWKIMLGGIQSSPNIVLAISLVILLLLIGLYHRKEHSLNNLIPLIMTVVPFVLAAIVSFKTNVFLDRYFIFTAVFILPIMAIGLLKLPWRKAGLTLLIVFGIVSALSYSVWFKTLNAKDRPGMVAAEKFICENASTNEPIFIASSSILFTYDYYVSEHKDGDCNKRERRLLYREGVSKISQLPHYYGTALMTDSDLTPTLHGYKPGQTVWLLWTTGYFESKPAVPTNWQQQFENKYRDLMPWLGDIFVTKYIVK